MSVSFLTYDIWFELLLQFIFVAITVFYAIRFNKCKAKTARMIWIAQAVLIVAIIIPDNASQEIYSYTSRIEMGFTEDGIEALLNDEDVYADVKKAYGSDFDYTKEELRYFDRIEYTAQLKPINIFEYISNKISFDINSVIDFKLENVDRRTESLVLVSDNELGYEMLEKFITPNNVEYFSFAGQAMYNDRGDLDSLLDEQIKEIDMLYDVNYPPLNGNNIMGMYKITRVVYADGRTEGERIDVSVPLIATPSNANVE